MSVVPTPLRRESRPDRQDREPGVVCVGNVLHKVKVPGQLFIRTNVDAPHAEAAFLRLLRYRLLHQLTDRAFGNLGKSGIEPDDVHTFQKRSMQRRCLRYLDRPYDDLPLRPCAW